MRFRQEWAAQAARALNVYYLELNTNPMHNSFQVLFKLNLEEGIVHSDEISIDVPVEEEIRRISRDIRTYRDYLEDKVLVG